MSYTISKIAFKGILAIDSTTFYAEAKISPVRCHALGMNFTELHGLILEVNSATLERLNNM
jgi:hypothetical protein